MVHQMLRFVIGRLGNFESDANGIIDIAITDRLASLYGDNIIANRAVAVRTQVDELGVTNTGTSSGNGNARPRTACGNILIVPKTIKNLLHNTNKTVMSSMI